MHEILEYTGEIFLEVFPERLKKLRTMAKMKQQELADELGVSIAALSYYETGKRVPDAIFIMKVSEYFNIPLDYLLGYTNSIKKDNIDIANKLHISDKAIEKIVKFSDDIVDSCITDDDYIDLHEDLEEKNILNSLLESDDFYYVLNVLTWHGYEAYDFIPDESYVSFLITQRMLKIINDIIKISPSVRAKAIKSFFPDNEKRMDFYNHMFDKNNQELKDFYKNEMKVAIKKISDEYERQNKTRLEAIKNIQEAEKNGKYNAPKE